MLSIIRYLRGYVRLRVTGFSPERFMNLCGNRGILLWNVARTETEYTMYIHLADVWKLRPIVRKSGTRVAVLERYGLPFFIPRLRRRNTFLAGCLIAMVCLYISSLFVWDIKLDGNEKITYDAMEYLLHQNGIFIGARKSSVELASLEKRIREYFPEITWVSVQIDGTRLQIFIKENDAPIVTNDLEQEPGFNLCSEYAGEIISMVVRSGVPKVVVGDVVQPGDVLVEGKVPVFAEDGSVRDYQQVIPKAEIWMEHEVMFQDHLPFTYTYQVYTGREQKDRYLRMGDKIYGDNRNISFLLYDSVRNEAVLRLLNKLSVPIYFGRCFHREYQIIEKEYTVEEAEQRLKEKISNFTAGLHEKGVHILENNVTIDTTVDGFRIIGVYKVLERVYATGDS